MPQFTREILTDTFYRSVVKFTWAGGSTNSSYGLTASVMPSELIGYGGSASGVTNIDLSVAKVFWSLPYTTTPPSIECAWHQTGSVTGTPFLYLNGSGYINYNAEGMNIPNTVTGASRTNGVTFRNIGTFGTTDTATFMVELDKGRGFGLT